MWWRKVLAKMLGWRVVWVQHHDGAVYLHLVRPTPFGLQGFAQGRWCRIGAFICLPDGSCRGASYVERWQPA